MKILLIITYLLAALAVQAQLPGIKNLPSPHKTPVGYNLNQGDTIRLGFGSSATNEFSFLQIFIYGPLIGATTPTPLPATYANRQLIIHTLGLSSEDGQVIVIAKPMLVDSRQVKNIWIIVDYDNAVTKEEIIR